MRIKWRRITGGYVADTHGHNRWMARITGPQRSGWWTVWVCVVHSSTGESDETVDATVKTKAKCVAIANHFLAAMGEKP